MVVYAEDILGEYHSGFRQNRSTIDHIFTIRQIQEKAYEYNTDLYNLFIDFKQAFDRVDRNVLVQWLHKSFHGLKSTSKDIRFHRHRLWSLGSNENVPSSNWNIGPNPRYLAFLPETLEKA